MLSKYLIVVSLLLSVWSVSCYQVYRPTCRSSILGMLRSSDMLFPSLSRELLNWPQLSRPIEQSVATFERETAKIGLKVDVYETDSEFVVQMDLDGFRESHIQIEVEDYVCARLRVLVKSRLCGGRLRS